MQKDMWLFSDPNLEKQVTVLSKLLENSKKNTTSNIFALDD
jgi:hypothetical protein